MKFKPTYNNILVRKREDSVKLGTLGLIEAPVNMTEKNVYGDVIAVGPGFYTETGTLIPLSVKEGDGIYFPLAAGSEIKIDGITFLLLKESDVIGIVE